MTGDAFQITAQALKYFALIVATTSSVWGATHDLRKEATDGQTRVTTAGKLSIGITVISLALALTSATIADKLARLADQAAADRRQNDANAQIKRHQQLIANEIRLLVAQEQARADQQRRFDELRQTSDEAERRAIWRQLNSTSTIVRGAQPLRAVAIEWTFPRVENETARQFGELQFARVRHGSQYTETAANEEAAAQFTYETFMPYVLNAIGGNGWRHEPVVAFFAFDDAGTVVLPVGYLTEKQARFNEPPDAPLRVAAGIAVPGMEQSRERQFQYPGMALRLDMTARALTIGWHVSPHDFHQAIDFAASSLGTTATLPDRISIRVLADFRGLGDVSNLVRLHGGTQPHSGNKDLSEPSFRGSTLRITPNQLNESTAVYSMKFLGATKVAANDEYNTPLYAEGIWIGERIPAKEALR